MSKVTKFRQSPERFFAESTRGWVRTLGTRFLPVLQRNGHAMLILENPLTGVAGADIPLLSTVARLEERRRAWRREVMLRGAEWPAISVVVPAYNAEGTIEASLRSLINQTYSIEEILVVDDASEDQTVDIVSRFKARYPSIRLLRNETTRGAAMARNLGLSEARGDYLAFQDADDISHPERFERQLAAILNDGGMVSICNGVRETSDGRRLSIDGKRHMRCVISMLFPRQPVFKEVGYMQDLVIGEDGEYFERICAAFSGYKPVHLDEVLYRARFSPNSLFFSNVRVGYESGSVTVSHTRENEMQFRRALARHDEIRRGSRSAFVAFHP